ncbi:MAG: VOC family protein [Chloroflexi bacterium]|nr:VOC family protein [Chloroflexota bacterium]
MAGTIYSQFGQIGIIVKDMDKAVEKLKALGMGPFLDFKPNYLQKTLWGKPVIPIDSVQTKIVKVWAGTMELELIQPTKGDSHWKRFLDSKGDGIQHLSFFCDDIEKEQNDIAQKGFDIVYSSRSPGRGVFYYETGIEGLVFEPSQRKAEDRTGPGPFGWKIHHVGVIVKDLDRSIAICESLGMGPFLSPKLVLTRRVLWGKEIPVDSVKTRIASVQLGIVKLEFIQPVEGDSHWQRYLDSTGGGMQHLGFSCDDIERAEAEIKRKGLNIVYSSRWGDGAGACYFEIGFDGMIFEVMRPKTQ